MTVRNDADNEVKLYFCYQHGDLEIANQENESYVPCVNNIKDFGSTYLFSIETQHTIGFGGRLVTWDEICKTYLTLLIRFS
jgi:hypothetical protein